MSEMETAEIEWCEVPGCVRPVKFHPGGLHLTIDGHEFVTPDARPSYLRPVEVEVTSGEPT